MKRLFDLSLIVVTLPIWMPVMALVACAVKCALGSPVLFRDARAGLHGRSFTLCKFRTMREGVDDDAVRLTRFGQFLRASSLDELPELFNVLRGEMSLVGPRPLPVRYLPRYTAEQRRRHDVLPGLTGWAQVNGRNALSWAEKFRYDVAYVERRSVLFDLKILGQTVFQVIHPRGINHAGAATMPEFRGDN